MNRVPAIKIGNKKFAAERIEHSDSKEIGILIWTRTANERKAKIAIKKILKNITAKRKKKDS